MKKQFVVRSLAAATALAVVVLSPAASAAGFTGNLGVVSKYVLRGITNDAESDDAALQAGVTYTTDFGLYGGWWGSSLDYASTTDTPATSRGFEHDFIVGYSMPIGKMTLDVGAVYYYYMDIDDSDAFEPYVNLTVIDPLVVGAKYLAKDVLWGNKGDVYLTATYTQKLPSDFTFKALAGFYLYEKTGKFLSDPDSSGNSAESSGFRHLDLTVSHPLGKSGLDMSVTYTLGGDNRYGLEQADTVVVGVSGAF